MAVGARYASLCERIIANSVVAPDHYPLYKGTRCWLWIGSRVISNRGKEYGTMTIRFKSGPRKGKPQAQRAHRISLREFRNRKLTSKSVVMHLCNLSICVNPWHLSGGTQKKNVRQTVAEGRHRSGYTGPMEPKSDLGKAWLATTKRLEEAAAKGDYGSAYGDADWLGYLEDKLEEEGARLLEELLMEERDAAGEIPCEAESAGWHDERPACP